MILTNFIGERTKAVHCFVSAFVYAAGIGIGDESLVKKWIEYPIDGVMEESVADARFVDVSWLRIANIKSLITAVDIGFVFEFGVEQEDVIHEVKGKFLDILFVSLSSHEFFPGL